MNIAKVPAAHGLKWLLQGLVLLRRDFYIWVAFVLILWAFVFVAGHVSSPTLRMFLAGVVTLLTPAILGGVMVGARAVEKGEKLVISHFFAGFRINRSTLLKLGAVYLFGNFLIVALTETIGGPEMRQLAAASQSQNVDPAVLAPLMAPALLASFVNLALALPLTMALWFSPLLVVFENSQVAPALRDSFRACLKNMMPFFIYGLLILVPLVLLTVPFGLNNLGRNPGPWIAGLLVLPSIYTSYRDIFQQTPVAPAEPVT